MGTQQQKAPQTKQITQFQIEIACLKVKGYVELNRDRRTNQALMREKALNEMLRNPSRVMVEEYQKFQQLVQDVRFFEACNIVLRYCEIIKDQSIRIFRCGGDHSKIADLMPYIESILFAADNLNLEQVMEFKDLMIYYFGPGFNDTSKLMNVDQDLKKLFKTPLPDAYEVNEYAIKFAEKYGFSEEQLNASGHQFSSKMLKPAQGGILVDQQGFGQFMPNQNQGFGVPFGSNPDQFPQPGSQGYGGGFGQPPVGGFGNPTQGGFGQPPTGGFGQPPTGGFGNPPQGGFGQSPTGGFGQPPIGGFGNPPQGGFGQPSTGGFGNPPQGGFGQPPTGGFAQSQPNSFNNQTQGGFGNQPSQNGSYNQSNNQFGIPPVGGFGTSGGYGQTNGSSNPYSCLNQGPLIMASQSMKVPQQQYQSPQQPLLPQGQSAIPQQQTQAQQQQNINNPNSQALDDLEARLRNLDKNL